MPITPFLRNQAFEPDLIEAMSLAFTRACASLDLTVRTDPMTELVARHIIEAAQRGIRTAPDLYSSVLQEFKSDSQ